MEKYDTAVALYLANMRKNELSETSIESYARTFRFFRESMVRNGYDEPGTAALLAFKIGLDASVTTVNLYMTHLKLLSEFCGEVGVCDPFFTASAMPPRRKVTAEKNKEYEHVLTEEQFVELLTAEKPRYGRKMSTWSREQAEVAVLITSGLRNSELRALTPNDLDYEHGVIHARQTKGDKPRYVPFPAPAQEAVKAYLSSGIRPDTTGNDAPLFGVKDKETGAWKPLERSQLSSLVFKHIGRILGEDACRTHALRHLYASVMLENGARIDMIGESLGHANLTTTKIYAQRLTKTAPAEALGNISDALYSRTQIKAV